MVFQCTTLPNGVRVATDTMPHAKSVAVAVTVGVGRRHEKKSEKGLSHMLEHMLFKGTKTRSAFDIVQEFEGIGADPNAQTTMDTTMYHAQSLPEHAGKVVELLSDIIQHSTFDEKELKREKGAVLEEILSYEDDPATAVSQQFSERAFPKQPLGQSILGTKKSVTSFRREDFLRHMEKYYRPDNMVFSAAGNIRHEDFVKMVQEHYTQPAMPSQHVKRVTSVSRDFDPAEYHGGNKRVKRKLEQTHLMLGFPTISWDSPRYPALEVYAQILGGGMSSRLFQEVREKHGAAYDIEVNVTPYHEVGLLEVYSAASPKNTKTLSRVLCEQLAAMAEGVTDKEVARAKIQLRTAYIMGSVDEELVAGDIGERLLGLGTVETTEETIAKIEAVTKEDVQQMAKEILNGKLTVATLGNSNKVISYTEMKELLQGGRHATQVAGSKKSRDAGR